MVLFSVHMHGKQAMNLIIFHACTRTISVENDWWVHLTSAPTEKIGKSVSQVCRFRSEENVMDSIVQSRVHVLLLKLVMLNSNFFQNRNSNPKNRLKLETCFLFYSSSMVKRVRISTFEFRRRFIDRRSVRSAHIKRWENLTCTVRFRFVCGRHAACQINWCIHNSTAHSEHLVVKVLDAHQYFRCLI